MRLLFEKRPQLDYSRKHWILVDDKTAFEEHQLDYSRK